MGRKRASGKALALGVAVTTAAAMVTGLASATSAGAASAPKKLSPGIDATSTSVSGKTDASIGLPAGVPKKGVYSFLLKLNAAPTAVAQRQAASKGTSAAKAAARSQLTRVQTQQAAVVSALPKGSNVLYRTHAALAGVAVRTDVKNFAKLKSISGVTAVYPIAPKSLSNSYAVPLQKAPQAWVSGGDRGENATVAIIDTGIDYTHSDFGGPGTLAAYKQAKSADEQTNPTLFPTAKVIGGYDLVGDDYNADPTSATYQPVPHPDVNPLDCNDHGSHVAGTVAGYGENSDGSTYTGAYDENTPFGDMRIGPGVAPEAKLYAFRVFGCDGSTDVVGEAIDRAADPNNDGDTSDHVDVINMSLGSDFGSPQDGDSVVTNDASANLGITMAVASGNNGDLYDTGGSPGNAPRAIAVAATQDAQTIADALNVTGPPAIAGKYAAERSIAYDYTTKPDLSGTVARVTQAGNTDGCSPLNQADKDAVNGKIAFVEWTDNDTVRRCGSVARSANLAAAGATGFIFANDEEPFAAGITGSAAIPGVLVAKSGGDAIRAQLVAGNPVTIGSTTANGYPQEFTELNDQIADFSSRGIRGAGNAKPDVSAVGGTVFSAGNGTGNQGLTESGTSMATPMVAGTAALVKSLHANWTPEQVKADIMNTADQDVFTGPNHTGTKYGPNRVGSGRIDIASAVDNTTLAYVTDDPGVVSASFGPLEVTGDETLTKTIKVQNTGLSAATYTVGYQSRTAIPGAVWSVSPSTVTVDPRSSKNVTVTLTITKSQLTKTLDPTVDRTQSGIPREFVADTSGLVTLTGNGVPSLRVPTYAAPRPTSTMTQAASVQLPSGAVQKADLPLTGGRINQGSGDANVTSLVAGFELQATSAALPTCTADVTTGCVHYSDEKSADLKYVGAASSAPELDAIGEDPLTSDNGLAYFAISTQGPWRSPAGFQEFDVYIDSTGDGVADAVLYNSRVTATDIFVSKLVNLKTGASSLYAINDRFGDTDSALFDSDTLVMPVALSDLPGIAAGKSRINYSVLTFGPTGQVDSVGDVASNDAGDAVLSDPLSFDVLNPGLALIGSYNGDTSPLVYADSPGTLLQLRRDSASYAADNGKGALIVHFQNKVGDKAQVVTLNKEQSSTALSFNPSPATVGKPVTATVTVTGTAGTPTGSVTLKQGDTTVTSGDLTNGSAQLTFTPQAAGSADYTAVYSGDSTYATSTSPAVTLTVAKAASTTTLSVTPTTVRVGSPVTATVTVTGDSGTPTGTVDLKSGATTVATGPLVNGSATLTYTPTAKGTLTLTAQYAGDATYEPSTSAASTVTVNAKLSTKVTAKYAATTLKLNKPVKITVTVASSGTTVPTGTVTLVRTNGGNAPVSYTPGATLANGKATITYTPKGTGSYKYEVRYGGDANFNPAVSSSQTLKITK